MKNEKKAIALSSMFASALMTVGKLSQRYIERLSILMLRSFTEGPRKASERHRAESRFRYDFICCLHAKCQRRNRDGYFNHA